MNTVQTAEHARALLDAYGDKAEAHAAQKANELRQSGEHLHAEAWQQVRKAIKQIARITCELSDVAYALNRSGCNPRASGRQLLSLHHRDKETIHVMVCR